MCPMWASIAHFDNCTVMDKDVYHYVRNDRVVRWEPRAAEHGGSATNPMRPVASPWVTSVFNSKSTPLVASCL